MCVLYALLLLLGGILANAFKEHDFKKCHNSAFCTRNRHITEGRQYRLLAETLTMSDTRVTGKLKNEANGKTFTLSLTSIAGPSLRLELNEDAPVERYRVRDILIHDPLLLGDKFKTKKGKKDLQIHFPDGRYLRLVYDPFELIAGLGKEDLIHVNANGMLHMEHTRESAEEGEDDNWEETFKEFKDSKPRGPQGVSLDVSYLGIQHVYGIPEHATSTSLPVTFENDEAVSEPYRLYNLDVFDYDLHLPFSLYGSIPLLLGQNKHNAVGCFWLNSAEMLIDIWKNEKGTHSQWIAESGVLDIFLMMGPQTQDVLYQYSCLTGTVAMPQYFALGYHQCRWNYRDEADVKQVDANFDKFGIPYDVLWLDIEHTDGKKYMTWNARAFPHPAEMQEDLASRGRKMVTIVDPHIKTETGYVVYDEAKKKRYCVKNKDGSDFVGHCWPGSSSYLDVTRSEVRSWWSDRFQMGTYPGMTRHLYIWNDMNEPSVFNGPEITMQKDLIHGDKIEHRDVHNLYGYFYHMATAEGLKRRGEQLYGPEGDRPFVLSRAYFAGSQRLGAIWTGDNKANWDHLKASIPMLLSNNLAGMPFCGADVAGFFGDPEVDLLTRWYQTAVFYPFFRAHAHLESKRREPWLFGVDTTRRIRRAIRERYALLPYIYTLFRQSNQTGAPILRPLWYHFLQEGNFEEEEQFMMGPALMIRPIFSSGISEIQTIFPSSTCWYDAKTGEKIQTTAAQTNMTVKVDMEWMPFYYRGGSIVVRKERPRRCTMAMSKDPVTLVVAPDSTGQAEGEIYIDDGHSYGFLQSKYLHRKFTFSHNELNTNHLAPDANYRTDLMIERIVILGMETKDVKEKSSGRAIEAAPGPLRFEHDAPIAGLIIKKPELSLDADWTLVLSPSKQ